MKKNSKKSNFKHNIIDHNTVLFGHVFILTI